jgi:hypothetical protein
VKTANLLTHDELAGPALMILKNLERQNLEQPRCTRNDDLADTMGSIRGSVRTPQTTLTWRLHQEERQGRRRLAVLVVRDREGVEPWD